MIKKETYKNRKRQQMRKQMHKHNNCKLGYAFNIE